MADKKYDYADEKKRLKMLKDYQIANLDATRQDLQRDIDEKNLKKELKIPLEKRLENPDEYSPEAKLEKGRLFKKGGSVKSSASSRADGCVVRGKTNGRMV